MISGEIVGIAAESCSGEVKSFPEFILSISKLSSLTPCGVFPKVFSGRILITFSGDFYSSNSSIKSISSVILLPNMV